VSVVLAAALVSPACIHVGPGTIPRGSFDYHTVGLGRVASLVLGYSHLDVDSEDGEGLERFVFDMEQAGPWVGLRFRY
jgi:hypothetical protein